MIAFAVHIMPETELGHREGIGFACLRLDGQSVVFFEDDSDVQRTIDELAELRDAMRARAHLPETVGAQ